jgi:molybdenum cofactor guanylyltransferase
VLVGGRSSRMGRDKALLPRHGKPMAAWVARVVAEAAGSATLVGAPERYAALGCTVIPDLFPGEGPLGGIITALRHSPAEWNLIVACDMPEIDAALLARLLRMAVESGVDTLLPVSAEGRPQPLCAVYRRTSLGPLEAVFSDGVRKVTAALETVRTLRLPVDEVSQFQNVNTPEDWDAYAAG